MQSSCQYHFVRADDMSDIVLLEKETETGLIGKEMTECSKLVEDVETIRKRLKDEAEDIYDLLEEDSVENSTLKRENGEDHYTCFKDQYDLPMFQCIHCKLTYSQKYAIEKHIKTHTRKLESNNTSVECDECKKPFNRPSLLKVHKERVHVKLKKYFCFVCQKGFHARQRMLEHLQVHDDARKSEERFLKEDLKMKLMLEGHIMFEGRKVLMEHVCPHCSKVFQKRRGKERHEQIHLNEKNPGLDTKSKSMVKKDVKMEQIKMEQTYSCKLDCIKSYYSEIDLSKHMERADHVGGFFFTCADCPKKFASTKTMKTHICDQTTEGAPIPVPRDVPSQDKPEFNTKTIVQKQTFSETKPKVNKVSTTSHNCKECGRNLPSSSSLEIHIKIHKEVNIIICKGHDCTESFANQQEYWAHKDSVHNEKKLEFCRTRVKCEVCGQICSSKATLNIDI